MVLVALALVTVAPSAGRPDSDLRTNASFTTTTGPAVATSRASISRPSRSRVPYAANQPGVTKLATMPRSVDAGAPATVAPNNAPPPLRGVHIEPAARST